MPHATCHTQKHQPQLAPNWKFARRGSLFGDYTSEEDGTTYSFILAAPQFTITIIFSSSLSLSLLLSSPFWRLRRIKIAAVSSKSQNLQCQHQFSTRQRIFRHLSRSNFHVKTLVRSKKKKLNTKKANKTSVTWRRAKSNEVQILCKYLINYLFINKTRGWKCDKLSCLGSVGYARPGSAKVAANTVQHKLYTFFLHTPPSQKGSPAVPLPQPVAS